MNPYFFAISLIFLIGLSAFFSAAETSMMAINRYRLRHLARKGHLPATRVMKFLERPDRLLGIILIGNTFANTLASAVVSVVAVHYWGDVGVFISTILLTLIILIFGETLPKTLAALRPQRIAFRVSWLLKLLLIVLYPLVWLINFVANACLSLFGVRIKGHELEPLSPEELRTVVREASAKISSSHQQILLRVLSSGQMSVDDVMVPRSEICGIDISDDWSIVLKQIIDAKHSRLPVYKESIDNVIGMLDLRQLLWLLPNHHEVTYEILMKLVKEIHFIPEGTLLSHQLLNFQQENISIGLVVDEYGDILGLVTMS